MNTKLNKLIRIHEKERKTKLIDKIKFELQLAEEIKLNRLWFKRS